MDVALIAAFPDRAEYIVQGDWRTIGDLAESLRVAISKQNIGEEIYESPVAQGISRGLCYIKKRKVKGHILVFDCSEDITALSSQSVGLSNCGWAAVGTTDDNESQLARISVVSLASAHPSAGLVSLVSRTNGIHIPKKFSESKGSLMQALLFHVCPPSTQHLKIRPPDAQQEMNAVCACHNKALDRGYVCSICLSIYCTDSAGICGVCGSRMRREAKESLPIHAQVFSILFGNKDLAGFPVSQNIFS
jgi:transcription initiation factor TFIIH subunit 3